MGKAFEFIPVKVPKVKTKNRVICTPIPVPASKGIIQSLKKNEPRSMEGQPVIVWDRAQGVNVYDKYGNKWIDFSSGVLVANAGHGRKEIADAIIKEAKKPLLHTYCFPNDARARLCQKLIDIAPENIDKVFLMSTGSEAAENAIKLSRTFGQKLGGRRKITLVTFVQGFHGRTMGSQMAGGNPALKEWIVNLDPNMVNVPYPDGFRQKDTSFAVFEQTLQRLGVNPDDVCGVMTETFQGGNATLFPQEYALKLRQWCDQHKALLIFDEIQAAMGRTGRWFGFQHYGDGIRADLICLGKGLSSCLPISAVLGTKEIMDIFEPGSMTSTHTGNPICCAAAYANIALMQKEKVLANVQKLGVILAERCQKILKKYPRNVGLANSIGLVGALQMVKPGTTDPDNPTAFEVVKKAVESGVMMFGPVGTGGASVKICPPLIINREQLTEGLDVLEAAFDAVLG